MGNDLYNSVRRSRLSLLLEKLRLVNSSGSQRVGKESWIWKRFPSGVNQFSANEEIGLRVCFSELFYSFILFLQIF